MLDALVRTSADAPGRAPGARADRGQAGEVPRNAALHTARTARADKVYTGVLYEALDVPRSTRPHAAARRAGWR